MYVLGIDVGTTGAKALVADEQGRVIQKGYRGYALITGGNGYVEQRPQDWYEGTVAAVRQALNGLKGEQVAAISMSTQGASALLADGEGTPLTNAITWMDTRAMAEKDQIVEKVGESRIYEITGWRPNPSLDLTKLMWLYRHEERKVDKARLYISTIEYMNWRLTGRCVIDPTNAAITQQYDIRTSRWSEELNAVAGINMDLLPKVLSCGEAVGTLTAAAAADLGLSCKVTVFNGAHDQYAGMLGANIMDKGEMMLGTGTCWVTNTVSDRLLYSQKGFSVGPHPMDGLYGAMVSMPVSGAAYDWFLKKVLKQDYHLSPDLMGDRLKRTGDLFFYPFFSGALFPYWRTEAKAGFVGLDLSHDEKDMLLSVMEGVAFQMKTLVNEYERNGQPVRVMRILGGATKSGVWMEIMRALFDFRMEIMEESDTCAVGAAILAGKGCGIFHDYRQGAGAMSASHPLLPVSRDLQDYYAKKYQRYQAALEKYIEIYPQNG